MNVTTLEIQRRVSYREHYGLPPRDRTPVPDQRAGGPTTFGTIIAPLRAGDPNQPRDPIVTANRFSPMSVSGVLRYDDHRKTGGCMTYLTEPRVHGTPQISIRTGLQD